METSASFEARSAPSSYPTLYPEPDVTTNMRHDLLNVVAGSKKREMVENILPGNGVQPWISSSSLVSSDDARKTSSTRSTRLG